VRRSLVVLLVLTAALAAAPSASARFWLNAPGESWVQVKPRPAAHLIAFVRPGRAVALRARPFGPVLHRVGSSTPFGSPRALAVVRSHRGRWLAVTQPELGNHRLGWVDARAGGLRYSRTALRLEVDLSSRMLVLYRGRDAVRRMLVGVGRAGSETPTGRYAVTDKLPGRAYSAYYGCCILALSATQPHLPSGWTGGNRVAIHGTPSSSDFGRAVSAGCMHARDSDLRYLMRSLPLGTPVVIRP
jgi:L,D-transpeptidase catalytic domain